MSIPEGLKVVDAALTTVYHDPYFIYCKPMDFLVPHAAQRATQTVFADIATSCGVGYNGGSNEIRIWHIGIMFAEYVAGLLEQKAREGHCRNHKKPCEKSEELHAKMLTKFKENLQALVKEIEALEAGLIPMKMEDKETGQTTKKA